MKKYMIMAMMVGSFVSLLLGLPQIREGHAKTASKTEKTGGATPAPVNKDMVREHPASTDNSGGTIIFVVKKKRMSGEDMEAFAECCANYGCQITEQSTNSDGEYSATCDCSEDSNGNVRSDDLVQELETKVKDCSLLL